MNGVALKGLLQRRLRALLTGLAVILGVAMVSGTFMLTDSMEKAFDSIFESSYSQTDAVVSAKPVVEGSSSGNPTVAPALLGRIRALPGVEAAAGSLVDLQTPSNTTKLIDRDGKAITARGAASLGFGVDPAEPRFIPLTLVDGAWARAGGEVVIDAATARNEHYAVGDRIGVSASGPVEQFRVAGVAKYGDVDSLGGSTIAVFELETAQRLLRKDGYDSISVARRGGTSVEELVAQIRTVVPHAVQVKSAKASAAADSEEVSTFIGYFRYALLAFGGIALFVGAFVIFNTLSITIAQRTRELATLRTLGASRRQVLTSIVLETLVIGVLSSLAGLAVGFGLAEGLGSLFGTIGLSLPQAGTVVATRTVVVSLAVGVLITLVAGLLPAIRATRVAPINAVREGATAPEGALGRVAPVVAGVLLTASAGAIAYGLLADGLSVSGRLLGAGVGSAGVFLGVGIVASRLVRPLAAIVGWPGERVGGTAGALARRNAVRNPGRTAATAGALMIGLTLVTTVAVLGQGLRSSATNTVERQIAADYVLTAENGFDTVPAAVGRQLGSVPGAEVSSVRGDKARILGSAVSVTGIDGATIAKVYRFRFSAGSEAALATLDDGGAIVRKRYADEKHLVLGDRLALVTPSGKKLAVRVEAILDQGAFDIDPLLGSVMISQRTFDATFPRPGDLFTFVNVPAGAGAFASQAIEQGHKRYPGVAVSTRDEFVTSRVEGISQILNLLYVLLALSVVVSLFGMINTLILAVFERTREIGMLRAIGLSRTQTRRMVRHESVVTALIGAALGLPVGLGVAAAVTRALSSYDVELSIPVGTLAVFVAVAIVAGVLAAIAPARRAGRLDVLRALQYE